MRVIYSNGYIHRATSDCGRYEVTFDKILIDGRELAWGKLWGADGAIVAAKSDIAAAYALRDEVDAFNAAAPTAPARSHTLMSDDGLARAVGGFSDGAR